MKRLIRNLFMHFFHKELCVLGMALRSDRLTQSQKLAVIDTLEKLDLLK